MNKGGPGSTALVSLLDEAIGGLWRARRMTVVSIVLIAVSLFLVGVFLLVAENLGEELLSHGLAKRGSVISAIHSFWIVAGKIESYYKDVALVHQAWVREPKKSVGDLIKEASAKLGENIQVRRFVRFQMGEE